MIAPTQSLSFNFGLSYLDAKFTKLETPPLFAAQAGGAPLFERAPEWSYTLAGRYELPFTLGPSKIRSEEHTSELQSLMRISYAVFCLKKKNKISKSNTYERIPNTDINTERQQVCTTENHQLHTRIDQINTT